MLITDIGSTTTKAILISFEAGKWQLTALADAPTTVEKPHEDVMAGVIHAVEILQKETTIKLISLNPNTQIKQINPEIKWLSTSSAGGGLQILVIGLTREESAASAQRAAYGVGGVLLDTIAIDDGRSVVEQMHAIEDKQPDIILMSGGYDGGAFASVLRQAEVVSYCEIKPKYSINDKIPLVYAGNADAQQAVKTILQDSYDVHLLTNLRPTEALEQTTHVSDLVHELFLNKVMQQAPGYKALSSSVSDPVIPTPLGVMQALKLIAEVTNKNILAVDIGGATTDVYSNIFGSFYRTVSANYGMSYNLCNVFASSDRDQLKGWLHPDLSETALRDYLANKMLNPTVNPTNDVTLHIEQALARPALQLSLKQHIQMNFSIEHIGHFVKIKDAEYDPFHEQFFRDKLNEQRQFCLQDFDIVIGAGGVISHAPTTKQAAMMIIDGLQPRGATEIWRDKHFITPHLGKLSQVDKVAALELIKSDCLEPLCLCIRPLAGKIKKNKPALSIELQSQEGTKMLEVSGNSLVWIDNKYPMQIKAKAHGSIQFGKDRKELELETSLPVLIDTRIAGEYEFNTLNQTLKLYNDLNDLAAQSTLVSHLENVQPILNGKNTRIFSLPYAGQIYVNINDNVSKETLLGENLYEPPRIFVLQIFRGREHLFEEKSFRKNLLVDIGEEVKTNQIIYKEILPFLESLMNTSSFNYYSPVRGKVEKIDWTNGTLILREIQDYSFEPVVIKLAHELGVKPRYMKGLMHKHKGDYITNGEILATKSLKKENPIVHSPATGTITDVDADKGTITIQYVKKNLQLKSGLNARVLSIAKKRFVELEYIGTTIQGSIGFGKTTDGMVIWNELFTEADLRADFITVFPFALSRKQLEIVAKNKVAGVIMPSMAEEDIVHLLGYELGVGITGGESLPFSIILTEGFGKLSFSPALADALKDCTGKYGVLFPATQIRAGVIRPGLIIQ